ncbi:MAG: tRNA threonylcarbamoyladenosine dehydratase, partial [Spirochaetaceae bacterium]|nr:tRNA threonylcarbamoyladenosine dehydratase [Spirochaetaceae bacterium]
YDFVIDAIDSLTNKLDLIEFCLANQCVIFSCMGMAQKLDPEKIKSGDIWKTEGCPLARLVRNGLRKRHIKDHFTVVYSKERLPLHSDVKTGCGSGNCLCPKGSANIEWCSKKKVINGSSVTVTASAGMLLASLVIRNVVSSG